MELEPRPIALPALRGNDPLGFLAALGAARLCHSVLGDSAACVGWPDGPSLGAVLRTSVAGDVAELSVALADVALHLQEPSILPGGVAFPPNSEKTADADPVRTVPFAVGRAYAIDAASDRAFEPWLSAVLALDEPIRSEKRRDCLPVTPFAARGPGTVMLARTLRDLAAAATAERLVDACTFWTRTDSIGGYLDPRAKRNASYAASRKDAGNYGVPAAAWLAMMSLPFFPALSANADIAVAPCWSRGERGLPKFTWPVWNALLGVEAVAVLLAHPAVADGATASAVRRLGPLGVSAVYRSQRAVEGNNDGSLGSPVRIWPR